MLTLLIVFGAVAVTIGGVLAVLGGAAHLKFLYEQGGEQHWSLLADRVGLLHGHDDQGRHVLDGSREDIWLHAHAEGSWMVVRGRIDAPLPPTLRITHTRERPQRPRLRTGNPILDAHARVEGDTRALTLLEDPDLAGALLAVVHAWPGSHVDARYVTLRCPDAMGRRLEDRCEDVIALVHALRRAARRTA
ncbi:MAG: hypothetical protein AAFV53_06615 [Myxococcota bacterium]